MKERPILFNDEMVRAILEGRKTQTRRLSGLKEINKNADHWKPQGLNKFDQWIFDPQDDLGDEESLLIKCPYGIPGDRLWVMEKWRQGYEKTSYSDGIIYYADKKKSLGMDEYSDRHKWKPSIHLKRKHSRILLEVTNVRVERVQDISRQDAFKEGCIDRRPVSTCNDDFKELWNSINEAKGFGWDVNPWVWVVEFRRIK